MSRSIPTTPANTLTPNFTTVSSPNGFSSGDLVYFRDSSFGTIPGNAVTSANFPITANVNQNQIAFNTTVNWANYNPDTRTGSTNSRAPSSALLTNGNIVTVFAENAGGDGAACFRIIDQNGAVVVNRTTLGVNSRGLIGVCALTGGGFAVANRNEANSTLQYAVFSNTGAVVSALTVDSNFGTSWNTLEIRALSGGGFVIAAYQGGSTFGFRTYTSTGTGNTYTSVSGIGSQAQVVITTFSDNTFAALYPNSSTGLVITRFNNTGGIVATYTVTSDWFSPSGYDFITLSTGIAVVVNIDTDGSAYQMWGRTYNQSTGAVSGRTLIAGNLQFQQHANAFALSSGGFIALNADPSTGYMALRRYDASFNQQSVMLLRGFAGYTPSGTSSFASRVTIFEGATFLTLVNNSYTQTSFTLGSLPYIQIDKSNITEAGIRRRFQASQAVAIQSAAVSGYARGGSTPNAASFFAANNQTITQTFPVSSGSTFAMTPFVAVSDGTITHQCMTDMTNGQFVISYRANNGANRFTVFNPDGAAVTTVVVAASGSQGITQCTCLGNGKLVVSWVPSSSDRVNFSVYAAGTYALLATGTTTGTPIPARSGSFSFWNSDPGHDIAPFGNDSFVFAYANTSGGVTAVVFNDSAVYQSHANSGNLGGIWNVRVASNASGTVVIKHYSSSQGQGYGQWFFRDSTTNSIFFGTTNGMTNYSGNNWGEGIAMSPYSTIFGLVSNGSSRSINRQATNGQYSIAYSGHSSNNAGVCVGQYGDFVSIRIDNTTAEWVRTSVSGSLGPYGTSVSQSIADFRSLTLSNPNTNASVGSQAQIVNLYDDIYAFSYINGGNSGSGQIIVGMICTNAASYSSNITAGVTPSNTALVPSPANGYYLAGVSASDCTAGGTGVLQINGTATLNSQYPAGTTSQSFDFNTPALDVGIRGTIAGRNVILSGGK